MTAYPPIAGFMFFPAALGALLYGLHLVQRRFDPPPEVVRKLFHVGGGMVSLALPLFFDSMGPVIGLGLGMGIAFVLLRRTQVRVLSGVARRSLGEVCFVAGVLIVFMLAKGDPLAYSVPVLVLTIADAGAGVLGSAFGRLQGFFGKTIEGSGVFFIAAFLVTLIPLMVTGAAQPAGAIAVSFLLAVTVTPVEAFSPYGLDNLLVPVASLVVFRGLM